MSKSSKRPGRAARDVHETIREQAAIVRTLPAGIGSAGQFPELDGLLSAAADGVRAGVPRTIHYVGRKYWMRARLVMQIDIFDSPGAGAPLVEGFNISTKEYGHEPGH